ncbi:translation initiation factor IF-2 [Helicobacter magdeburgensis]|uniref:Translation initiation factor IF-2 n=1 Tax=Helicobacter magdeburgensis TaxID=471858 RepID=A0A4U8SXK9_9HELI|nr:translation initiation factor IF-2 [Helicobacter magdeburgensis]TLD91704.1 translation initiation factor IF-2 [Helicobacter magdeburgensis]
MEKIRLAQIGQEFGKDAKFAFEKAKEMGLSVKTPSSSVTQEEAAMLYEFMTTGVNPLPPKSESKKSKATKSKDSAKKTSSQAKDTKAQVEKKQMVEKEKKPSKTKKEAPLEQESKKAKQDSLQTEALSPKESGDSTQAVSIEPKAKPGLRIVRKNDKQEPKGKEQSPIESKKDEGKKPTLSYKELLAQSADKEHKKHKKDKHKPKVAHKHTDQKIHILDDRDIGFDYDDEQDEIMLFDLNETQVRDEDEENKIRQAITDRVQIHRKNPWMNEGSIKRGGKRRKPPKVVKNVDKVKGAISIPEEIRVYEFAELIRVELKEVIKVLFNLGLMATKNDFLDRDAIEILADEFELEISIQDVKEHTEIEMELEDAPQLERPPVVTIMGHVDHGKTSLLDYIRNSRVASGEAGGITQHIGAYMVEKNGKKISFIDTPGHEAFTQMRSRGAQVTDIAIIVIAADDGVKQQTIEALNHAKAANVQIIIAMNKMDKENANPDKLKAECAELGFTPNEWGGEYEFIPISAKSGEGVENLLETILIQAEVLELKASHQGKARAIVLEASLEKGRGPVATIIVQQGVLNVGDSVVADTAFGRVRALLDDRGQNITQLYPSGVAVVTGLSLVPSAGAVLQSVENDTIAREHAQKRALYLRQKELSKSTKVTFDELGEMVAQGNLKSLPLIVKADTQGSLEAIKASLEKLSNDEVRVNIIGFGVGGISESDIDLSATSENSLILGFNVRPTGSVKAKAKELGVEIKTYSIIYSLLDDIKALLGGLMSPVIEEENTGQAEVRETFNIPKVGVIAGCMVVDGSIQRGIKVRLIRDGVVVHTGSISSLKRFKDDAKEVSKGYECGIMLENYNDIKVGDVFETYKEIAKTKTL